MWFDPSMDIFRTNFSVGGQPIYNVEVDTGSAGLIIPITQIDVSTLGPPVGTGVAEYGTWGSFYFTTYAPQVDFGNGMVTAPIPIGVVDQVQECQNNVCSFIPQEDWWQDPNIKPLIGVGPYYAVGAYTGDRIASPPRAMPGNLSNGFLFTGYVDQGSLTFGENPLPAIASVPGWFYTDLAIDVTYSDPAYCPDSSASNCTTGIQLVKSNAVIDSGGLGGGLSTSMLPAVLDEWKPGDALPPYTTISVYTPDGKTLLYSTAVTAETSDLILPSVWEPGLGFNTGIIPFLQGPIYFSYTPAPEPADKNYGGTTYFD